MAAPLSAQEWIDLLDLQAHPEGGYFQETYRSALALPAHGGLRAAGTAIYFLVTADGPSCLHRLRTDEVWHFYAGSGLEIVCIDGAGEISTIRLGLDIARGERPQATVPAGLWFGARVTAGEYALCGCTMAPGFDFEDFELGDRAALLAEFPQHAELVLALTQAH